MVEEVKLRRKYLNEGDVFILDLGLHLIQVRGIVRCTCKLRGPTPPSPPPPPPPPQICPWWNPPLVDVYSCLSFQWNGTESNKDERAKAAAFMMATKVRMLDFLPHDRHVTLLFCCVYNSRTEAADHSWRPLVRECSHALTYVYVCMSLFVCPRTCGIAEGDVVDESHVFYKMVPPGFWGSKQPKAADKVQPP